MKQFFDNFLIGSFNCFLCHCLQKRQVELKKLKVLYNKYYDNNKIKTSVIFQNSLKIKFGYHRRVFPINMVNSLLPRAYYLKCLCMNETKEIKRRETGNWDPPPSLPGTKGGGGTLACGRGGGGVPIPTTGEKALHSVYSVCKSCGIKNTV